MAFHEYIPMDRRQALSRGEALPDRMEGAILFADISGFTPLTETLAKELGPQQGAEELSRHLNLVFSPLITEIHKFHGSVIGFSGDAVTSWFGPVLDTQASDSLYQAILRAIACGLAMQRVMEALTTIVTPAGARVELAIKVAITAGRVRRFLIGDPQIQRIDLLAGKTVEMLSAAEHLSERGEIVLALAGTDPLPDEVLSSGWRKDPQTGLRVALVSGLTAKVDPDPWPELIAADLTEEQARLWLLPAVYERLKRTGSRFLGELRPVSSLFLAFRGIDYDEDDDAGLLLDAFIRRVQASINRYEGALLQVTMGDKGSYLYACFGAPVAHDDDAARAVGAALELSALPGVLGFIDEVQIGLTHGQTYAGAYGASDRHTYGIQGDKANLAARLMQQASPGEILCDDEIYHLARGRWSFEVLPPVRVKGKAGLIRVYRPTGAGAHSGIEELPLLVGREAEVARIEAILDDLQLGKGKVLLVQGDAGIGKSRLVAELVRLVRERGLTGLLGTGQSIEQQTPYRAWKDIFYSFFDLNQSNSLPERQNRVRNVVLEIAPKMAQRLPLLNDVLDLELPDTALTAALDPALRQESLSGLMVTLLQAWARERPLVLVLEDAHWLDSLSWDLAVKVTRTLLAAGQPLLMMLVFRPFDEPHPAVEALQSIAGGEALSLAGLDPERIVDLVTDRLGLPPGGLPEPVASLVRTRAGGNPFFAEELIYNIHDQGLLTIETVEGTVRCVASPDLAQVESILPDSIQGLILARIDRLPVDRQLILKVAAVIGRSFPFSPLQSTLQRFAPALAAALESQLRELSRREFTLLETLEPELTYIFKHIITQEVAYQTLLFDQRKEIHRAVAEWYEGLLEQQAQLKQQAQLGKQAQTQIPDLEEEPPVLDKSLYLPLLVHHYHHAGDPEKERYYARLAGQQAEARFALSEAVAFISRALELTPESDLAGRYELLKAREKLYSLQGNREGQWQDFGILDRITDELNDNRLRVEVLLRLADYQRVKGDYPAAISAVKLAIPLAQKAGADDLETEGLIDLGRTLWKQANYPAARRHLERALEMCKAAGRSDAQANCLTNLGIVADLSGDRNLAEACFLESLAIFRKIKSRHSEATALNNLGIVAWRRGNMAEAQEYFEGSLQIYREIGSRSGELFPLGNLAMVTSSQRKHEQSRAYAEQSVVLARETGERYGESRALGMLAKAYLGTGDYLHAFDLYRRALDIDREIDDRQDAAHRLGNLGYISVLLGDFSSSQSFFEQAFKLSQEIGDRDAEMFARRGMCLLFHYRGEDVTAIEHGQQALQIAQEISDHGEQAATWTYLGHARYGLGDFIQAAQAYQKAAELLRLADAGNPACEPLAGLALISLDQGNLNGALTQVEKVLADLESGDQSGYADISSIYLACYRILKAAGNERAGVVLKDGYQQLMEKARGMNPEQMRMFIENVPSNRELAETWGREGS